MFLRLEWPEGDREVSWLIGKKPGSEFERELGPGRRVRGAYAAANAYRVRVENDPGSLRERLREREAPTRVSAVPHAVCPPNLTGAREALRGAVAGRGDVGPVPEDRRAAPRALAASLGPFAAPWPGVGAAAGAFGLRASPEGARGEACCARFEGEMPLAEFLQRVFVLAYHLTVGEHWERWLDGGQVRSLIEASRGWLASCPARDDVVRSLTGGRRGLRGEFDVALDPSAPPRPDLHALRHDLLLSLLPRDAASVVEIGAGAGLLTARVAEALPGARVLAIDASRVDLARLRERAPGVEARQCPATHPYVEADELRPGALILSEVVEHLGREERGLLLGWVRDVWEPGLVLLTTPNRSANAALGVPEGRRRHRDHQVEYDEEQLSREVLGPLSVAYDVRVVPLVEGAEHQPSFVVEARRRQPDPGSPPRPPPDLARARRARELYAPEHVHELGVVVTAAEMADGLSSAAWRSHRRSAFYLAPTVAPAGADPGSGLLEDPRWALRYFRDRGVKVAYEQHKLMGSRAHVIAFRDRRAARAFGFDRPLAVNSRAGTPLLDGDSGGELLDRLHAAIAPRLDRDVVAFDAELMPWRLRGAGLIRRAFRAPAEAAALDLAEAGLPADGPERFLETLGWFDGPAAPELVAFGMLAEADVGRGARFHDVRLWPDAPVPEHLERLGGLLSGAPGFSVCPTARVDLLDEASCEASCGRWAGYTGPGGRGEGFVYRPESGSTRPDGGRVQPAMKVRGARYLELLYGWGYLDKLGELGRRPLAPKRAAALVEDALARRVLQTFFRRDARGHDRAVAAFLGVDGAYAESLDPAL